MSSASRSQRDALSSLMERLPDPQDRDWYAALVSYIQSLPPQDELVQLAQLFGFLTLIGRELPEALAVEQAKLQDFLGKAYLALQQEVKTNGRYHEQLHERLGQLPEEIAAGVKPEAIARAMSESFRQQLAATGLAETKTFLTEATRDLKRITGELDMAVRPIVSRYDGVAAEIQNKVDALDSAAGRLREAAQAVDRQNAQLRSEVQQLQWWILPSVALALLLVGAFLGAGWEQRHTTQAVIDLQNQVQQLQETIKNLPAALAPAAPPRRPKKTS